MIAGDTFGLAFRNLRQAKLRTALTTMGVSIGIASLAGMVSLGVGLQEQLVGRFMNSGLFDVVTVLPGDSPIAQAFTGRGGRASRGGRAGRVTVGRGGDAAATAEAKSSGEPARPAHPLNEDAVASIRAIADVKDVTPSIVVPVQIAYGETSVFTTGRGISMAAKDDAGFRSPKFGTFLPNETDRTCLLALPLAESLTTGDAKDLVGQEVTISYASAAPNTTGPFGLPMGVSVQQVKLTYRVAGIVERDPNAMGGFGGVQIGGVMLPLPQAREIDAHVVSGVQQLLNPSSGAKSYASVTVRVTKPEHTKDVEDRIKALGFTAISITDGLDQIKRVFLLLDILLSLIGSIALVVSSLGIVNTMVMSILERTREIGIMKAIGGSDGDIRRIFLVEASAIGLMGGACGVLLGWIVGRLINFGANWYIESQGGTTGNLFSLPIWLIAGAIGFSWFVSLAAGLYPATRASRLDPIHALRHD